MGIEMTTEVKYKRIITPFKLLCTIQHAILIDRSACLFIITHLY